MEVKLNHSLRKYNTFGIECIAKKFIEIHSEQELSDLLKTIHNERIFILGGGSNILLQSDYEGTIIKLALNKIQIVEENKFSAVVKAGAGVVWDDLVKYAVENKLAGIENLSLIPGSTGAAPIQNIGAYGQELRQTFQCLEGYYISEGNKAVLKAADCRFGYRDSVFKQELKDEFVITSVTLKLNKNFEPDYSHLQLKEEVSKAGIQNPKLKDLRNIIIQIRKQKLPDPDILGNAGSFFKNPIITSDLYFRLKNKYPDIKGFPVEDNYKVYAGWLIEKCGWKGKRENNVGTYFNQALVIVNYGGATAGQILDFSKKIKESVSMTFGIELQEEVNII